MDAITLNQLSKTYDGGVHALKGIDLRIPKGAFYGLLGPNGAGKSTTIGILCGLVTKSAGEVMINGFDLDTHPAEAKKCLGIVPQEFNFNIFEPCHQIITNHAGYYGVPRDRAVARADDLLKALGIFDKRNTPAGKLSGGMKRRLMIARALAHDPSILILDEPTAGVDISLRRSMYTFLEEQNKQGLTIVLTTHYLEEAEALCERIAIIDKGRIAEDGPTHDLLDKLHAETVVLYTQKPVDKLPKVTGVGLSLLEPTTIEALIPHDYSLTSLIELLALDGILVHRMRNKANRLEELFVNLVEMNA